MAGGHHWKLQRLHNNRFERFAADLHRYVLFAARTALHRRGLELLVGFVDSLRLPSGVIL